MVSSPKHTHTLIHTNPRAIKPSHFEVRFSPLGRNPALKGPSSPQSRPWKREHNHPPQLCERKSCVCAVGVDFFCERTRRRRRRRRRRRHSPAVFAYFDLRSNTVTWPAAGLLLIRSTHHNPGAPSSCPRRRCRYLAAQTCLWIFQST